MPEKKKKKFKFSKELKKISPEFKIKQLEVKQNKLIAEADKINREVIKIGKQIREIEDRNNLYSEKEEEEKNEVIGIGYSENKINELIKEMKREQDKQLKEEDKRNLENNG